MTHSPHRWIYILSFICTQCKAHTFKHIQMCANEFLCIEVSLTCNLQRSLWTVHLFPLFWVAFGMSLLKSMVFLWHTHRIQCELTRPTNANWRNNTPVFVAVKIQRKRKRKPLTDLLSCISVRNCKVHQHQHQHQYHYFYRYYWVLKWKLPANIPSHFVYHFNSHNHP